MANLAWHTPDGRHHPDALFCNPAVLEVTSARGMDAGRDAAQPIWRHLLGAALAKLSLFGGYVISYRRHHAQVECSLVITWKWFPSNSSQVAPTSETIMFACFP